MILAQLSSGHFDLADFLFLLAFIAFLVAIAIPFTNVTTRLSFVNLGLALVALAFFVS